MLLLTYSGRYLYSDLELRRDFTWIFVIVDLPYLIIGEDFLCHFLLLVNVHQQHLLDSSTVISSWSSSIFTPGIFSAVSVVTYHSSLNSFPELTNLTFNVADLVQSTRHFSNTNGLPMFAHPHYLPHDKLNDVKSGFYHMLCLFF